MVALWRSGNAASFIPGRTRWRASFTTEDAFMTSCTVGIDAISLSTPRAFLELADLAAARGVPVEKYTNGLGAVRMAIAGRGEDPVTLATDAAARVIDRAGIDPETIGMCAVGTETGIDHSKPIASYVHGLLELPRSCRVFDAKHACFGGTAALMAACEWIASGAARGRRALVLCTDIARYALGSPGEPTQGAGAVAMIVSERPRLLEIEVGHTGRYARDVHDFWRPLNRRDALVDGHFSVACYLDAFTGAFEEWRREEARRGCGAALTRAVYHVPYPKMARKADRQRATLEGLDDAAADARFAREVAPSLLFSAEVGNIYTGSLYMAVASLLHVEASRGEASRGEASRGEASRGEASRGEASRGEARRVEASRVEASRGEASRGEASQIEGARIGLFSYGSGCGAELFAARVADGAAAFVRRLALDEPIRDRVRLSFEEYEAIRRADAQETPAPGVLDDGVPGDRTAFLGVDEAERRVYRRAGPASGTARIAADAQDAPEARAGAAA
jgi:hydroxymethylglutaryl-CoA synthase